MITRKSTEEYWKQFSAYQSFQTVAELNAAVKQFISLYDLTDAIKAVLNTIKLHAKRYFPGVCWLRKEKIAKKAGVSPSTVDRAIKGLKEVGILTVIPFNHTKYGRRTHNVYVINPIFEDAAKEVANEVAQEAKEEPSNPCASTVSASETETHKNLNTNPNTSLNHLSIKKHDELKFIPNEFIDLMEPFYANNPEIIRDRWKTTCVAIKKSCLTLSYTSWDTIGQAWNDVVRFYKRGKIKDSSDYGLGGYFYKVLTDYLTDDFLRNSNAFMTGEKTP